MVHSGVDMGRRQRWKHVDLEHIQIQDIFRFGFRTYSGGRTKSLLMGLVTKNEGERGIEHDS